MSSSIFICTLRFALSACLRIRFYERMCAAGIVVSLLVCPMFVHAAGAATEKPSVESTASEEELAKLEKDWWEAIKNRDKAALEVILADEFIGVDDGADKATNKRQWIEWAVSEDHFQSYSIEKLEMRIVAETAIVAVHYSTHTTVKGVDTIEHGVDMDVLVRRNGHWQALGTGEVCVAAEK